MKVLFTAVGVSVAAHPVELVTPQLTFDELVVRRVQRAPADPRQQNASILDH